MTEQKLNKLSRSELLELLIQASRENEELALRVEELEKKLNDRTIKIKKAGSLAEAALSLNGVYEAAEAAAKQYVYNIKLMLKQELEKELRQKDSFDL